MTLSCKNGIHPVQPGLTRESLVQPSTKDVLCQYADVMLQRKRFYGNTHGCGGAQSRVRTYAMLLLSWLAKLT